MTTTTTAIEAIRQYNIVASNEISHEEALWLEDHELDASEVGIDGSNEEMEDFAQAWEDLANNVGGDSYTYVAIYSEEGGYFENLYEFYEDEEAKGIDLAIRACEEDKDFLDMTKIYSGTEFKAFCEEKAKEVRKEIEERQDYEETYNSLRWQ